MWCCYSLKFAGVAVLVAVQHVPVQQYKMLISPFLDFVETGVILMITGSGSHENVRSFKIIAMEKQVQTSIMHQKRFGEGERLANKTS